MNKRELARLRIPRLPGKLDDKTFLEENVRYIIKTALSPDKRILILAVYERDQYTGIEQPYIVVYLGKDDYISKVWRDGQYKWSTACLMHIYEFYPGRTSLFRKQDIKRVNWFLRNVKSKKSIMRIMLHQEHIMEKRLIIRRRESRKKIDARMAEVKPLPKDFDQWLLTGPFRSSRYIYYKRLSPKMSKGFCTHCRHDVQLKDVPKHNKRGVCPFCKSIIIYKAVGLSRNIIDDRYVTILQSVDSGGAVLRFFRIFRNYRENYREPRTIISEYGRIFISQQNELKDSYIWSTYWPTCEIQWLKQDQGKWFVDSYLYPRNLRYVMLRAGLQHSLLEVFTKNRPADVLHYINQYRRYPVLEQIYKAGLTNLYTEFANQSYIPTIGTSGELRKVLGVTKDKLAQMRRLNVTEKQYELIKGCDHVMPDEDLLWLTKARIYKWELRRLLESTTICRARKYIEEQMKHNHWNDLAQAVHEWLDYLDLCVSKKYNLRDDFVRFPGNLRERHDQFTNLLVKHPKPRVVKLPVQQTDKRNELKSFEELYKEKIQAARDWSYFIEEQYLDYKRRYGFSYKGLMIVPPKNGEDLIKESIALRHCVVGYAENLSYEKTKIFFIRRISAPDVSYFTLELRENSVFQCEGFAHAAPPETVKQFYTKWLETVVSKAKKHESLRLAAA